MVDITCDSDGKIDQFAVGREISNVLPMHPLRKDEKYHLGLFLTGAYQDVMGDMHNLFGRLNEVHIFSYDDDPQDFYIEEVVHGGMKPREGVKWTDFYEDCLKGYTYLKTQ